MGAQRSIWTDVTLLLALVVSAQVWAEQEMYRKPAPVPIAEHTEQPVDPVKLRVLTDKVLTGDPQDAAGALAGLLKDRRLAVESVFVLLPRIGDCGTDIALDDGIKLLWAALRGKDPNLRASALAPRLSVVLLTLGDSIHWTRPGIRRNASQLALLSFVESEYLEHPSEDLLTAARLAVYGDGMFCRPESGAKELLGFLQRLLDKARGTLLPAESEPARIARACALTSESDQEEQSIVRRYAPFFEPAWAEWVDRQWAHPNWGAKDFVYWESEYWRLFDLSAQELLEVIRSGRGDSIGGTLANVALSILTGTREARKRNFDLLIPTMRGTSREPVGDILFDAYLNVIPDDAPADEKKHQDVIIDILDERASDKRNNGDLFQWVRFMVIDRNTNPDVPKIARPYARKRIVEILRRCASRTDYEIPHVADKAQFALKQILDAFPSE